MAVDRAAGRVYVRLREMIVRGRLSPGVRVAEAAIAEWLGVSRTPVREALKRLQRERLLVAVAAGTGARTRLAVAPLVREQMEELYRVAGALEGVAARGLAALPERERARIVRTLEESEKAFKAEARKRPPDLDRLFEIHKSFHQGFMQPCAGPETRALLGVIEPQIDRYDWFYAPLVGPDFGATHAEHGAIMGAIEGEDPEAIEIAVRANWINSAHRLGPVVSKGAVDLPTRSISSYERLLLTPHS
ncbi:GntR family transcriptional regulator [soil metagenome]